MTLGACSILATRPVQEMSDTAAALRAAREVQADILAPDLFRRSNEIFFKARREYKFKNFQFAKELATQARRLAEQAEYDAIRGGATRGESSPGDPYDDLPSVPKKNGSTQVVSPPHTEGPQDSKKNPEHPPNEEEVPLPVPTPADVYEQRKAEEAAVPAPSPVSTENRPFNSPATTAPSGTNPPGGDNTIPVVKPTTLPVGK